MASSVKKKDIKKLRDVEYLAKEVTHRLPAKGQIVPTPEPQEKVVFVSPLSAGWDFPSTPLFMD